MAGSPSWSTRQFEMATKLWAEGLSASQIGEKIGTSKSSVTGMAARNRIAFPKRPPPCVRKPADAPKVEVPSRAGRIPGVSTLPPLASLALDELLDASLPGEK